MNKRLFVILICGLLFVAGCGPKKDMAGNANVPKRVVCMSPVITEMVFALGTGEKVVGISSYSIYPQKALSLPVIGTSFTPNKEAILALKPDLIIGQGHQQAIKDFGKLYNIRVVSLKMDTMNDVYESIMKISDILVVPDNGKKLVEKIKKDIVAVHNMVKDLPYRKTLVVFGRTPGKLSALTTIGPSSFLNELITKAGGTNIFSDARGLYPQISLESLLKRKPDVVLELYPEGLVKKKQLALRNDWNRFSVLPAVENDNIYYMTNNYLLIPGPRMGLSVRCFAEKIHPEAFK